MRGAKVGEGHDHLLLALDTKSQVVSSGSSKAEWIYARRNGASSDIGIATDRDNIPALFFTEEELVIIEFLVVVPTSSDTGCKSHLRDRNANSAVRDIVNCGSCAFANKLAHELGCSALTL